MTPWLTIIGIGAGGVEKLPADERSLLAAADTVIGPERLLAGLDAKSQIAWQAGLPAMLEQIKARRGRPTSVLASGDPLWFGIGATLVKHLGVDEVAVYPAPSSLQLAAARLKWPLQHVTALSLHGRPVELLHPHLLPGNRVLALTSDHTTIAAVRDLLLARGFGASLLTVLENLGAADERTITAVARDFDATIGDLYVLAIECVPDAATPLLPPTPGLPDEAFRHDGQLTKREVRAATLAKLGPFPGARLWDVGAGCGSIAIEWMRAARDSSAVAFERDVTRQELIAENARALGTPALEIVGGEAPDSLGGKSPPDAIFFGGDVANTALFDACWVALKPRGRLVANAVTLSAEAALYDRQDRLGGELTRIDISVLDRIGNERVLRPRLPVTQWLVIKP